MAMILLSRTRENKREQERTRENKREQERTRENNQSHQPDLNYQSFDSSYNFDSNLKGSVSSEQKEYITNHI